MKISHICAIVSILYIVASADENVAVAVSTATLPGWIDPGLWKQLTANLVQVVITLLGLAGVALGWLLRWLIARKVPGLLRGMARGFLENQVVKAEKEIQSNEERFKVVAESLRAKSPFLAGLTDEQIENLVKGALAATAEIRNKIS